MEKAVRLLENIQKAHRTYVVYTNVKARAIQTKQKMAPIVENIKQGMDIGQGIGKVLNDEVTPGDVRWVIRLAQNRVVNGFERAVDASKKTRNKKRSKKPKARQKGA